MSFSKLDSNITKSSIWATPATVRVVWISFLAEKDQNGFVGASRSGMQRVCNVTAEEFDEAVKVLESPDTDSRSPEYDGRRIEKIEGGWIVLNSDKYRLPEEIKREQTKERVKNFRALQKSYSSVTHALPSVSESVSVSNLRIEECEKEGVIRSRKTIPPTIEEVTEYCNERENTIVPQKFYDHYQARGWRYKGNAPMKDWQAAVRTWEGNSNSFQPVQAIQPSKAKVTAWKLPEGVKL